MVSATKQMLLMDVVVDVHVPGALHMIKAMQTNLLVGMLTFPLPVPREGVPRKLSLREVF